MDSQVEKKKKQLKPHDIYLVTTTDSHEFNLLSWALTNSSIIGLDAEWGSFRSTKPFIFPTVSLLQIGCQRPNSNLEDSTSMNNSWVFLVDLLEIPLSSIYPLLSRLFLSPDILKLGFGFKQDLMFLSSTFCSQGCDPPAFDKVEPYIDIANLYDLLQKNQQEANLSKNKKGLAAICLEVLGIPLSKEQQCSDWSQRPLTEEQKSYAAADVQCLLEIFTVFERMVLKEEHLLHGLQSASTLVIGQIEISLKPDISDNLLKFKLHEASDVDSEIHQTNFSILASNSSASFLNTFPSIDVLSHIVKKYGDSIVLKEKKPKIPRKKDSYKKPNFFKRKAKRQSVDLGNEGGSDENCSNYERPLPWDLSLGGDGFPKFLCDVKMKTLAKDLRCVGIDAELVYSRQPDPRVLIDRAHNEKRVLLTQNKSLLNHDYLIRSQVYLLKKSVRNDQLLKVIETFELKISKDQLMSRCTKCNKSFIQLTNEQAIEATKATQVIPSYVFRRNLKILQCTGCRKLHWEGPKHYNEVQRFIGMCQFNNEQRIEYECLYEYDCI